jgi:hypothetical protein
MIELQARHSIGGLEAKALALTLGRVPQHAWAVKLAGSWTPN